MRHFFEEDFYEVLSLITNKNNITITKIIIKYYLLFFLFTFICYYYLLLFTFKILFTFINPFFLMKNIKNIVRFRKICIDWKISKRSSPKSVHRYVGDLLANVYASSGGTMKIKGPNGSMSCCSAVEFPLKRRY